MPRNDKEPVVQPAPAVPVGRTFRGETSVPITTPEAIVEAQELAAASSGKTGAVSLQVYFVARGIHNPILQASMLAYTQARVAPPEDFDEIFVGHNGALASKIEEVK
jgi:hypothetical protein